MAVMLCVRHPLSLRNVDDLLSERGVGICHEMVRFWWNRFGPMFADEIRRGERHYRWRSTDHEGEILETYVTKKRYKSAALRFLKKTQKRHCRAETFVTDRLRSYPAALAEWQIIAARGWPPFGARATNGEELRLVYVSDPKLALSRVLSQTLTTISFH